MAPMTDELPDPTKIKVQLNTPITWEWMAHLDRISSNLRVSKSRLVREALEEKYPLDEAKKAARRAGSTK